MLPFNTMFFSDKNHIYQGFNLRGELIYHYTSLRDMKCINDLCS